MPALQLLATWTSSESGMYSSEFYGPQVEIYRPDTAQFVSENIWHMDKFCISQTSVGLAINCFLWDKPQAPLPSVENHLMEGVVTLGAFFFFPSLVTDWQHSLSLSPCLSLFVSVPLSLSVPPTPHSAVCLDQTAPASISDFQSISATFCCLLVCQSSEHPLVEGVEAESLRVTTW